MLALARSSGWYICLDSFPELLFCKKLDLPMESLTSVSYWQLFCLSGPKGISCAASERGSGIGACKLALLVEWLVAVRDTDFLAFALEKPARVVLTTHCSGYRFWCPPLRPVAIR
jgi:hypothetical protein